MNDQNQKVEQNILLTHRIMMRLIVEPAIFDSLPDKFELVILPDDDPELRSYNLDLLDRFGSEACPVVFARLSVAQAEVTPQVFAPVLKAA